MVGCGWFGEVFLVCLFLFLLPTGEDEDMTTGLVVVTRTYGVFGLSFLVLVRFKFGPWDGQVCRIPTNLAFLFLFPFSVGLAWFKLGGLSSGVAILFFFSSPRFAWRRLWANYFYCVMVICGMGALAVVHYEFVVEAGGETGLFYELFLVLFVVRFPPLVFPTFSLGLSLSWTASVLGVLCVSGVAQIPPVVFTCWARSVESGAAEGSIGGCMYCSVSGPTMSCLYFGRAGGGGEYANARLPIWTCCVSV